MTTSDVHSSVAPLRPCALRLRNTGALFLLLLMGAAGCGGRLPLAPAVVEPLDISPELQSAYDVLTSSDARSDWEDGSIGGWASRPRSNVQRIVIGTLPTGTKAQFNGVSTIVISHTLISQPTTVVAGFIAHELRHADGLLHECADRLRDRRDEDGAWSVHIAVLRSFGLDDAAEIIRAHKFCEAE